MRLSLIKNALKHGALDKYSDIYADTEAASDRYLKAVDRFAELFGDGEGELFSVPGRSEISGNHTDHNNGSVLAGAIDRDIIAVARKNGDGVIRFFSEGYPMDTVELSRVASPDNFKNYTSASLIAGIADGFMKKGYTVGGCDVYATSDVLKGSGISSSAAYEVMIGNVLNHLYCGGEIDNKEIARLAQYAENVFFGKPCGLMDQMACAVGGFVYIDFGNPELPVVEPIGFSLADRGYALAIINTGGNHADLNDDYASVPREMRAVAGELGRTVLGDVSEDEIVKAIPTLREKVGDRAILRALHFIRENARVKQAKDALVRGDIDAFLGAVNSSGSSSFKYLQNVYTTVNVGEQGLSLALALIDGYLSDKKGAHRVHGGGFAGTVQVFVKKEELTGLVELMDSVFGVGSAMPLNIRPRGAIKIDLE